VSTTRLSGCSTSVALTMGPTDEEEEKMSLSFEQTSELHDLLGVISVFIRVQYTESKKVKQSCCRPGVAQRVPGS